MLRSITGTAGALALALLLAAGCSSDDDKSATGTPAPVSADGSAAEPLTENGSPAPAPDAAGAPAPTDGQGQGQPLSSDDSPPPPPSRPAGDKLPDAGKLRAGWMDATVTSAGGSCYDLKTAAGVTWSVYSKKVVPVDKGDKVRARITPGKSPVDCGSGKPATLVRVLINPK